MELILWQPLLFFQIRFFTQGQRVKLLCFCPFYEDSCFIFP